MKTVLKLFALLLYFVLCGFLLFRFVLPITLEILVFLTSTDGRHIIISLVSFENVWGSVVFYLIFLSGTFITYIIMKKKGMKQSFVRETLPVFVGCAILLIYISLSFIYSMIIGYSSRPLLDGALFLSLLGLSIICLLFFKRIVVYLTSFK
jgi:hypothetical protein